MKAIWERMLNFSSAICICDMNRFQTIEKRNPFEVIPQTLPDPIPHDSQREG